MRYEAFGKDRFGDSAESDAPSPSLSSERRNHPRFACAFPGRYMTEDGGEYNCITVDVSPAGLSLKAARPALRGEHIVAYIQELGRLEGVAVRGDRDGFAMALNVSERKIERLASRIAALKELAGVSAPEAPLRVSGRTSGLLRTADQRESVVEILDHSATSALFRCGVALNLGDPVEIEGRWAVVARLFPGGAVADFI